MGMLQITFFFLLCESASVLSAYATSKNLPKAELVEISRIAEEEIVNSFSEDEQGYVVIEQTPSTTELTPPSTTERSPPSTTEPTPPSTTPPNQNLTTKSTPSSTTASTTPSTAQTETSLEDRLRQTIVDNGSPSCNISEAYLWTLCRPVLLRTCQDQYRTQCRRRPQPMFQRFGRRLRQKFPHFSPPDMSFLQPKPLDEWLEDQMEKLRNHTDRFQFSVSVTTNNYSRTFTDRDLVNRARNFSRTLEDLRRRHQNMFPRMPDWRRLWGRDGRDHDDEDSDDNEPIIVVHSEHPKPRIPNPSLIVPKRVPKQRVHGARKLRRHRRIAPSHPHRTLFNWNRMSTPHMRSGDHQQMMARLLRDSQWPRMHFSNGHLSRPSYRRPTHRRVSYRMPTPRMHLPSVHVPDWPQWMAGFQHHQSRDNEEELTCEEMEEDPEVCVEIVDRKEKCHNELSRVCPEYVAARRQLKEQLENAYSSSRITEVESINTDDRPVHHSRERYQWTHRTGERKPIVIESIQITQGGSGDAFVTARLHGKSTVKFRVPAADFGSDNVALGRAIGKKALEGYLG